MAKRVNTGFDLGGIMVALENILPLRTVPTDPKKFVTLNRVLCSMKEVGLLEPLSVHPARGAKGKYTLLDGHLRLEAAKRLGWKEIGCLIAHDDEAYTYNHKVNTVPPLQQHFMILRAVENGVPEERIAASLSVDVETIRRKRDMLNGVCPEAVELLKDQHCSREMFRILRKVKPVRQIEMAELMVGTALFTSQYAKCLVAATAEEFLVDPSERKVIPGVTPEDTARMEREMRNLEQDLTAIEESHSKNVLNLVLTAGYLRKLLANVRIAKFIQSKHPDMCAELSKLTEASSLER